MAKKEPSLEKNPREESAKHSGHECSDPGCSHDHNHAEHVHEHANPQQPSQEEQERYIRMNMLEQQARQIDQQLQVLDQQIIELQMMKMNLEDLKKANINDELLTPFGKNIFLKTSLLSKDLFVEIGAKTLAKKSIDGTAETVDNEITKLADARKKIMQEFTDVAREINTA